MPVITWYDVLGVLPDAPLDDIRDAREAREALLGADRLASAPLEVQAAADRARQAVQRAWRVLADPGTRESYDVEAGFAFPGEGLPPPWREADESLGEGWPAADDEPPHTKRSSRIVVPDMTGLFYRACTEVAGRVGLHVAPIRLTPHPLPVEGLVVGQEPAAGEQVHHDSTLTVRLWHPPDSGHRGAYTFG